uniref:DNA repair protein RecO n=1 Tax=Desulfobacca acetoxidans TaxID=60893 RepID=A0A7C3SKL0_9BACT
MSSIATPAIVLTVKDLGEADRLVTFLTPDRGRLTGLAKHAKKSRQRFANVLEPLNRVDFYLSARPAGDLEFLQKGALIRSFSALRRDLRRLGAAAVLAELAGELASPPEAAAPVFAALEDALGHLETGVPADSILTAFALHLLKLGGYAFRLAACVICGQEPAPPLCFSIPQGGVVCGACQKSAPSPLVALNPGTWKLLRRSQEMPRDKLPRLVFPVWQRNQSLAVIRTFLRYHLGRELKSWSFWEKVA